MAKIISIDKEKVLIGTDDKSIKEVSVSELNFKPCIGDEIEIFTSNGKTIVNKVASAQAPANGKGTKLVNKTVYCLLAFFLGAFGAHKFYAGKIGAGIAYLVFIWAFIPCFIAFIEFLIGISKPADENGNILI